MIQQSDIPLIHKEFNPCDVPWQAKAILDMHTYDYSLGVHQVLFSGSVGSAKTLLMAHLIVKHCIENPKAWVGIGRLTMTDLKDTLLYVILEHMGEEGYLLDYTHNKTRAEIMFCNGARISCFSWHDKKYKKFRSYPFTVFAIEELTENDTAEAYEAIIQRLGRSRRLKEKLLLMATNPDDPEHWVYEKIIDGAGQSEEIKLLKPGGGFEIKYGVVRHIYYSLTKDNKFLDPAYYDFLERNLDPLMAERMLRGRWISIGGKGIYYQYGKANEIRDAKYKVDKKHPIRITWDFNIAEGKPMSCTVFQFNRYAFHWFAEFVVHTARTGDILEEIGGSGLLEYPVEFIIHGDASGKNSDTRQPKSDYDLINEYLANYRTKDDRLLNYSFEVPGRNPALRTRHNLMNAQMQNLKGQHSFFVYIDDCPTLHKGLRLTKLKAGGHYVEDDSKAYQHVTTAAGYGVVSCILGIDVQKQETVEL